MGVNFSKRSSSLKSCQTTCQTTCMRYARPGTCIYNKHKIAQLTKSTKFNFDESSLTPAFLVEVAASAESRYQLFDNLTPWQFIEIEFCGLRQLCNLVLYMYIYIHVPGLA